jgi:hypothetical protein
MPVKACIWNVQDYGKGDGVKSSRYWGANSHIRNLFIKDFVVRNQIDVLLLIEVGERAEAHLEDLLLALNTHAPPANWCWSYCGSALLTSHNPPQNKLQITFQGDARYEGYAVLWRQEAWGAGARFRLLGALHDIAMETKPAATVSPLNMVTRGRPAGNVHEEIQTKGPKRQRLEMHWNFRALGGYLKTGPNNKYPFGANGNRMNHWPQLELPAVGRAGLFGYKYTRRPVYVVLERWGAGTPRQALCPIAAYHAPSNRGRAGDGTLISGLSRELYVTNGAEAAGSRLDPNSLVINEKVVYGGDYNLPVGEDRWPGDFRHFWHNYAKSWEGGADCEEAPWHEVRDQRERGTIVRLLEDDYRTPIRSTEVPAYFGDPLDLVFTRPDPAVTGERVNALQQLLDGAYDYRPTLMALHARLLAVVNGVSGPLQRMDPDYGPAQEKWDDEKGEMVWRPQFSGGGTFVSFQDFMADLRFGQMRKPRRAAELYRLFISDHLPLVASIA